MSNGSISKITLPNNSTYDIKDISARIAISKKIFIDSLSAESLCALHISEDDFFSKVTTSSTLSNELYIVSSDYVNAYGQQIKNLAAATDLSDAVTLEQLSNAVSSIQIPTDLSSFTNSPGYLKPNNVNIDYVSNKKAIYLSAGSHVTSVDCNDFIKDGMLSTAELCGTTLVLKFNTDAGSQPISVQLSSFVDNYDGKITYLSNSIDTKLEQQVVCPEWKPDYIYSRNEIVSHKGLLWRSIALEPGEPGANVDWVSVGIDAVLSTKYQAKGNYLTAVPNDYKTYNATVSSLSNDGYTTSSDLTAFYKKSETSSTSEISNALSAKADLSSIEHVVQYEQDDFGLYTAVTIGSRSSNVVDKGYASFVQGSDCVALCSYSHAEGRETIALEDNAHAEGNETSAMSVNSHAEGHSTLAAGAGSHAEGSYTSAFGDTSHTEGGWTSTGTNAIVAHAEGGFTRADGPISHVEGIKATAELSDYQSFVWQGTDVMPNELTDITPSTWDEYKAHGPGTFNINPVSGAAGIYIGEQTLASMLGGGIESIEWADLTSLVQTSALNPGAKYRIIDYVTTVDQEDCRSAEHPFDLIVTAIDYHTLDEHAIATLPSNGDDYFDAREFHIPDLQQYLEYARVPLESWEIKYCLDNNKTRFKFADTENGKGVIYYMKDEFGNEAPYDFKNVQFKRYKITSSPRATNLEGMYGLATTGIQVDELDEMWCYTFNGIDYADYGLSEPYDFSGWHIRPLTAGQDGVSVERLQKCTGNIIQARYEDTDDFSLMSFKLPNNVFHCALTDTPVSQLSFLKVGYCGGNKLGLNCYDNTFNHTQLFNVFGNNCYSNTFGHSCYGNVFGNSCYSNVFGDDCYSNTFGYGCYSNTIGSDCDSNTFGDNCYSNALGGDCNINVFGNYCNNNVLGDNCDSSTFGDNCYSNTFGDNCYSNTFGNNCIYINFASTNTSDPSQAKSYYKFITVDGGNQRILLNCTQSTYSGYEYKNVRILPGVNNTSTWKTITDSNVNQNFCTTYQPANSQVIAV